MRAIVVRAEEPHQIAAARGLFKKYAHSLRINLDFQGFEQELSAFPGPYTHPTGALFVAYIVGLPVGCVGIRQHAVGICEMKRLYVRPSHRSLGIGHELIDAAVSAAAALGYKQIVLDTLPAMHEALALYRKLGFHDIAPYYNNPNPGTRYLCKSLCS